MIILDTNVVSETMQLSPSPVVMAWFDRVATGSLFVTVVTVAEIFYGVELLPGGKRREKLQIEAEATFAQDFPGRILAFDEEAARVFSKLATGRRSRSRPIADFDAQIAAIAVVHGATLATRNVTDFQDCGVRLTNPWE
ncbi:MAG: type II toxin-antitoxin system VapC family toxin [Candidatus Sulfotelmatobacter sp.]